MGLCASSRTAELRANRMKLSFIVTISILLCSSLAMGVSADEIDSQLAIVAKARPGGVGSQEAQRACRELAKVGTPVLAKLLPAMDTGNIVAANWLRTVYDQVVDAELASKSALLPMPLLKDFVRDERRQGRVRRHVLATLDRVEPKFREDFISSCLNDAEFRGDAVADALARGDKAKLENNLVEAVAAYQKAFQNARDSAQITAAADKLGAAGQNASIVEQMGLVVDWYIAGPFDAPAKTGFNLAFPPEKEVDLKAEYDGKDKRHFGWKRFHCVDRMGSLDLAQAVAPVSEAIAYTYAELNSADGGPAQVRCGADDNLTVWLNGEKVFGREQWLNGIRLDRFIVPVELKKGTNRLLVKVCQGPPHSNPAVGNNWTLQIRVCKPDGATAGLTSMLPPIADGNGAK